jgi:hypothetical protein
LEAGDCPKIQSGVGPPHSKAQGGRDNRETHPTVVPLLISGCESEGLIRLIPFCRIYGLRCRNGNSARLILLGDMGGLG